MHSITRAHGAVAGAIASVCFALLSSPAGAAPRASAEFLSIDAAKIHYQTCGAGEPLILLHDGLIGMATWDRVWDSLCKQFRVVRYDRRGFGLSDRAMQRYSPRNDLLRLMRHLNMTHATIAAVSSGSGLAVDFTIENPGLVDGLILMGPVLHGMYESPDIDARGAALNAPTDKGNYEKAARNWSTDPTTIERTDVAGQKVLYNDIMRYPQSLKFGGQNEIRLSPPAALRLSEVRVPTLILVGKDDHPDVHAFAGALENGIAGARRLLVVGAAHLVQIDKPAAISAQIIQYGHMARVARVAPATLASYAGRYNAGRYDRDGKIVTIVSDGTRLLLEAPAEPNLPIWPTSSNSFFMQAGTDDITVRFQPDSHGNLRAILTDSSGSVAWPRVAN